MNSKNSTKVQTTFEFENVPETATGSESVVKEDHQSYYLKQEGGRHFTIGPDLFLHGVAMLDSENTVSVKQSISTSVKLSSEMAATQGRPTNSNFTFNKRDWTQRNTLVAKAKDLKETNLVHVSQALPAGIDLERFVIRGPFSGEISTMLNVDSQLSASKDHQGDITPAIFALVEDSQYHLQKVPNDQHTQD